MTGLNVDRSSDAFALHCRGDVRLYFGQADCTPKSKKGRALLAILAAEQRPLFRVKIIDLLWSDRQEEQARASLRTLLADLKEQFGDRFDQLLAVDRERVALRDEVRTDLTDPSIARPVGELFEGLDHIDPELDEWLRVERERWETRRSPAALARPLPGHKFVRQKSLWIAVASSILAFLAVAFYFGMRSGGEGAEQAGGGSAQRVRIARSLLDKENAHDALRARQLLLKDVQERPGDATALGYLAEATITASDHSVFAGTIPLEDARREARAYGRRALQLDANNPASWAALGWSRFVTAESVAPFERAVALDPNNARYRTQLGRALEYQNRYDEAYFHQRRAMELAPLSQTPVLGFIRVAVQLDRVNEMNQAVAAYEARRPKPHDLAHVKGYLAYSVGDDPGCVRHLEPVVSAGNLRPLSTLINCLSALGEIARAAKLDSSPSLRSDVLRRNVANVERRALYRGPDFWLRNFETLAAADLLVKSGKAQVLVASFDANYDSVAEFSRQGGRIAMDPISVLLAMQAVGRHKDAAELRAVMVEQARGHKAGMRPSTWALLLKAGLVLADGERDKAVSLLEQCFPDCFVGAYEIDISRSAIFGRLNDHHRFRALVSRYRQQVNKRRKEAGLPPIPLHD